MNYCLIEAFRANVEKSQYSTNRVIRYLRHIDANTKYLMLQFLLCDLNFIWKKLISLLLCD